MKICPIILQPKWSFVISIPGRRRRGCAGYTTLADSRSLQTKPGANVMILKIILLKKNLRLNHFPIKVNHDQSLVV
jgi:hypothetical protein